MWAGHTRLSVGHAGCPYPRGDRHDSAITFELKLYIVYLYYLKMLMLIESDCTQLCKYIHIRCEVRTPSVRKERCELRQVSMLPAIFLLCIIAIVLSQLNNCLPKRFLCEKRSRQTLYRTGGCPLERHSCLCRWSIVSVRTYRVREQGGRENEL